MADASLEQLVVRARRGDARAFADAIGRCERAMLAAAFGVLGDEHAAADAVQDAAMKAWLSLGRLADPARFAAWGVGIARNRAIDAARRPRPARLDEAERPDPRPDSDPSAGLVADETARHVAAAVASLDEPSRVAVVLRYFAGWTSREIGEALDLTPEAVDMRLSRAREKLRTRLEPIEQRT